MLLVEYLPSRLAGLVDDKTKNYFLDYPACQGYIIRETFQAVSYLHCNNVWLTLPLFRYLLTKDSS